MHSFPGSISRVLRISTLVCVSIACATRRPPSPPDQVPLARDGDPLPLGAIKDHDISGPACGAFSIDGISLGMTLEQIQPIQPIASTAAQESPVTGRTEYMYFFRAQREGRKDYVQIGFDSDAKAARVVSIKATIIAGEKDPWPASIFKMIGSPRLGKLDEWGWWNSTCGAAMKIDRISALGPGAARGQPYTVEIRSYR